MHVTPTRESFLMFCVPSVTLEPIIKESSRMVFFQILSCFEGGSNTLGVENTHIYVPGKGRTNDLKPSSPKLGTSQGRISHALEITVSGNGSLPYLPNLVSNMVISNACDPPTF